MNGIRTWVMAMRIRVQFTVEVDPDLYIEKFLLPDDVRADVRLHVNNQAIDHVMYSCHDNGVPIQLISHNC
jgi:hypothetical protein